MANTETPFSASGWVKEKIMPISEKSNGPSTLKHRQPGSHIVPSVGKNF
jgi:hypothetical protein